MLTLTYLRTKNILVSFGAHLMIDWGIFTATLIVAQAVSLSRRGARGTPAV